MGRFNRDEGANHSTSSYQHAYMSESPAGRIDRLPSLNEQMVPPVADEGGHGTTVMATASDSLSAEGAHDSGPYATYTSLGLIDRIAGDIRMRIVVTVLFVVLALVSAVPLREHFTSPSTYEDVVATLDEKRTNVMGLVGATTAASAGISLIPDDVGTPIAEKLMDLSGNLMIILAVIYLEKYMLTVFGAVTFLILVPAACALVAIGLWFRGIRGTGTSSFVLAAKLVALGAVLMLTVPVSVQVTNMIDDTYAASIAAQEQTDAVEEEAEQEEEKPFNPLEFLQSIPNAIAESVTSVSDEMLQNVNNLIEQAAVMIVTSCLVPVLVLAFFIWMAHLLLGVSVEAPTRVLKGRADRMRGWGSAVGESKNRYKNRLASKKNG